MSKHYQYNVKFDTASNKWAIANRKGKLSTKRFNTSREAGMFLRAWINTQAEIQPAITVVHRPNVAGPAQEVFKKCLIALESLEETDEVEEEARQYAIASLTDGLIKPAIAV